MITKNLRGLKMAFNSAVLAAENGTATVDTTTTLIGCIDGKIVTLGAQTNTALSFVSPTDGTTAITATSLTANQACLILHCINASGTYKNLQGPIANLDAAGNVIDVIGFPNIPDTLLPFGYTKVKAGSTSSGFIPGTTNWNATGVTSTAVNIATLPSRPLTS